MRCALLLFALARVAAADVSLSERIASGDELRCVECTLLSARPVHFEQPVTFYHLPEANQWQRRKLASYDGVLLNLGDAVPGNTMYVSVDGVECLWTTQGWLAPRSKTPMLIVQQRMWALEVRVPRFAEAPRRSYAQLPPLRAVAPEW